MKVTKKIAAVFMSMLLCIMAVPLGAVSVSAETYGDLTYKISNRVVTITDCSRKVTEVDIPAEIDGYQVTSIGNNAFDWCTSLTSITIPDSVTSIDWYAFEGCTSLTSITVDENNQNYSSIDGVLFNKDLSEIIAYPAGKKDSVYVVPNSVISIGNSAFAECALTSIIIPDSVTSIDWYAFEYCELLESITIPDSVTSIGNGAFSGCDNLTIYGYTGSTAEAYANDNKIDFIGLDWVLANGDITGDDKLTTEDVLWLRKYIIGKKSMSANQAASADLNGDGIINSFDVVMMKKAILTAE